MIIGEKRERVIENIRQAAEAGDFHAKVEIDDPVMTAARRRELLDQHLQLRTTSKFRLNSWIARRIVNGAAIKVKSSTRIIGFENLTGLSGGAIFTSNHFNPIDNVVIRILTQKMGKKNLCIVSQDTNLMMPGLFGFLMNYADILPISPDPDYMLRHFECLLRGELEQGNPVLIYPEQEMWFNYRKPRPLKPGAYHYAAKLNVPVISCFVEITDLPEQNRKGFCKPSYTLHVLNPIYPNPEKSVKENRTAMCRQDYLQKKAAYETAYHKPLNYQFESADIAGWVPS